MTDKPHTVSRRDFLKTAGNVLSGLAINRLKIPGFDPFDPNRPIPNSFIFKENALSRENPDFNLSPVYQDHNTLKYTSVLKNPIKLNHIVKYVNPDDLQIDPESLVTGINWIIDPTTSEETSICTLEGGKLIAFFAAKNMPIHNQLFDFGSNKILGSEVLRDHCINIKFLEADETENSKAQVSNQYYAYDNFHLNFINSQIQDFYRRNNNDVQNISTSNYEDEQLVTHTNNRVFGLRFVGSHGSYTTSILSWKNNSFIKLTSFPENETAMIFDDNQVFPSVLCLDNGQIGFISLDREFSKFETNKFKMSFKIVDSHGLISKLDIPNPLHKYRWISNFFINIEGETDVKKISSILLNQESFRGDPADILAIFKINKEEHAIGADIPWILIHYPDSTGEYKLEELELPQQVLGLIDSKNYNVKSTHFVKT